MKGLNIKIKSNQLVTFALMATLGGSPVLAQQNDREVRNGFDKQRGYGPARGYRHLQQEQPPITRRLMTRKAMDKNHDSIISAEEAAIRYEISFTYMDENDDGKVSLDEFSVVLPGLTSNRHSNRHKGKQQQARQSYFEKIDKDEDSQLSQTEYMSFAEQAFEDSDQNHDGKVTVWEFRSTRRFWE